MIKDLLQKANFTVEAFTNGRDAWDRLEDLKKKAAAEQKPVHAYVQCLISDIEMPQMDGMNLCKRVKEDPALQSLPVLLFSSLITDKLRHKGTLVGADEQISKPEVTALAQKAIAQIKSRGWA
jgi:two-component system chemotaxis response regulator CheV